MMKKKEYQNQHRGFVLTRETGSSRVICGDFPLQKGCGSNQEREVVQKVYRIHGFGKFRTGFG